MITGADTPAPRTTIPGLRRTIGRAVTVQGIGLHLGEPCTLVFTPAPSGAGIVFRRGDRPEAPAIPARVDFAVSAERRTQLGQGDESLHTVEHVLAAVGALGIDDLTIVMDGPEPPIMDGSALPFLEALQSAGLVSNDGPPDWLILRKAIRVVDGDSIYEARPADALTLDVSIDFPHPLIGRAARRLSRHAAALRRGTGRRAHVRLRARGGSAAREGTHPGGVHRECRGARRAGHRRDDPPLARRIRAPQGARLRRRPGARGRRVSARTSPPSNPVIEGPSRSCAPSCNTLSGRTPCTPSKTSCRCCRTAIRSCWSIASSRSRTGSGSSASRTSRSTSRSSRGTFPGIRSCPAC